jgi:hypothetical protein
MLSFWTGAGHHHWDDRWKTPVSRFYWDWWNENDFDLHAVLELSGEVTSLKTELGSVGMDMKGVTDTITELTNKVLSAELGSKTTRSELTSLRSGLAGLTSSLLATKSQTDLIVQVRMSYTVKQSCFTSFAEPLLTFSYLCPKICHKRKVKQLGNTFGFGRNVRATF